MARTNGTYTRPVNSFSQPISGTTISPTDADTTLDDIETALDTINILDTKFSLLDNGDPTKVLKFDVSPVTAATTRTITVPDANITLVDPTAVSVIAGAGLTGGGTVAASRTLDVGAGTGIAVNANDVALATITGWSVMVNNSSSSAAPAGVKISALTDRSGFGAGDKVMIEESTGELRKIDYNDLPGAGSLGGSTGATDNLALRADGTGGATVQASPLVIADTTGSLSRSGNGGIPVQGTNTNDSAAAGYVGEVIESTVLVGASVTLTSGNAADITSISLTAGDWDVWGNVFISANATSTSNIRGWVHTTSTTEAVRPNGGAHFFLQAAFTSGGSDQGFSIGMRRYSLAGTTTIYLEASSAFSGGSANTAYGYIGARRVR